MSLLEDVFLQDEANEAQELERIIEGDEFEGRPRSDSDDNSEKEDEAEEDKRRVDPNSTKTRRVIKNPRFILNPARLTGPRGIQVIPDHFKDFKFKGKGHEREDLDLVLKKLEHWAYRLYPKFQFEDCLKKIETLGKKRPVMVHLQKIRSDQYLTEETVVQKDSSDEEAPPEDEFDKLLQQQIELARSTPAPGSVKKVLNSPVKENRSLIMPKATSSPSISEEQRERMLRNRKLAEERRLARLKNQTNMNNSQNQNIQEISTTSNVPSNNDKENINNGNLNTETVEVNREETIGRHNRSNVIDSSDDEMTTVNESIRVDVHNALENNKNPNNSNDDIEKSATNTKDDIITDNVTSNDGENNINNINVNTEAIEVNTQVIIRHNRSNIIDSSDEDEGTMVNVIENGDNLIKSNEKTDENNTSKNDIVCDKENNEDIEITSNNCNKDDTNLVERDINKEAAESNKEGTGNVDKIAVDDRRLGEVNIKNQEIDKNQNDYVDDLMDVDFSEDF